eukprot:1561243-Amphidinium_carterae.1
MKGQVVKYSFFAGHQCWDGGGKEILTLGEACDLIVAGCLAAAMDILALRMKAIEMAAREGGVASDVAMQVIEHDNLPDRDDQPREDVECLRHHYGQS